MKQRTNQTEFDFDSCGDGILPRAAQAVALLPPKPQQSASNFVFNAPDYEILCTRLSWRILIQVVAAQMDEYAIARNQEEREAWLERMLDTLARINARAQKFNPPTLPLDLAPPTAGWAARNANGVNWCEELTAELSFIFLNVKYVDTLRTEIPAVYNVTAPPEVVTLFVQQGERASATE